MQPDAAPRLLTALRAELPDSHTDNTPFETFCTSPGILAAQCTLLAQWPQLTLPERRGQLFLALLWHCLGARGRHIPSRLLPSHLRGPAAVAAASKRGWALPLNPGPLLQQLSYQADLMQDAQGKPQLEVPATSVPPDLKGDEAQAWLDAVRTLGLAEHRHSGMFAFVHQQWLEFFAALGLGSRKPLPELAPPPLSPPTAALLQHLAGEGTSLQLPRVTEHHERIRLAVDLATDPEAWLCKLIPLNLALAAQLAIDQRARLEPDGPWPVTGQKDPHPVLQHLRRVLLLRSVDAGEGVQGRLGQGGVLAVLQQPVPGLPDELHAHWAQEWGSAFKGEGRDVRQRLQAGLLLGELGDNLRYGRRQLADGRWHPGQRLKPELWAALGTRGRKSWYRIGSDSDDGAARSNEKPSFSLALDYFQLATYPVTVGEWARFVDDEGYKVSKAEWWKAAGPAAQAWLVDRLTKAQGKPVGPRFWGDARFSNPLHPVMGITAHEALAYAAWAAPLYEAEESGLAKGQRLRLAVPTEAMWEAGMRGATGGPGRQEPAAALVACGGRGGAQSAGLQPLGYALAPPQSGGGVQPGSDGTWRSRSTGQCV